MAKKDTASTSERLTALMADRHRYELWLSALESERESIPDHVYERIHGDYTNRLDEITRELMAHIDALEAMLAERQVALEKAEATVDSRTDALLEAEVRFRIGEYDEADWQAAREKIQKQVVAAERVRDKLADQIERLSRALEQLQRAASAEAEELPDDEEEEEDDDTDFFLRLAEESAKGAEGAETGGSALEPGLLDIALDDVGPSASKGTGSRGAADSGKGKASRTKASEGAGARPKAPKRLAEEEQAGGDAPLPKPLRTLECERCGTFNLPDAEYCDACGKELVAA